MAITVLITSIVVTVVSWDWLHPKESTTASNSETLRNVGLLIGGALAFVFALWRGWVAERQAETAQKSLLNERYERGAEMLGSDVLEVRLAGIYALQQLAAEEPWQYHVKVVRLFCAFVVHASKDTDAAAYQETSRDVADHEVVWAGPDSNLPLRTDIQAAMDAICRRRKETVVMERYAVLRLGLTGARLNGIRLLGADLSYAILTGTDLSGAYLTEANLSNAWLDGANLSGADLMGADLSAAVFVRPVQSDLQPAKINRNPATGLTQEMLDEACAEHSYPPALDGVTDAETGKQLEWRGGPCSDQ